MPTQINTEVQSVQHPTANYTENKQSTNNEMDKTTPALTVTSNEHPISITLPSDDLAAQRASEGIRRSAGTRKPVDRLNL